jgi:hypothetical protein
MLDWYWDTEGGLKAIKTVEIIEDNPTLLKKSHSTYKRYWYYTQAGWYYIDDLNYKDQQLPVMEVQPWAGDHMPIVVWRLAEHRSLIADASAAQREYYNITSELTEQRRETGFAMLVLPQQGGDEHDARVKVGSSDNVLWSDPEAWQPYWLERKGDVQKALREEAEYLSAQILKEMGLDFDEEGGGGTTGIAYQFKMSKIVRMLKDIVGSLQRAENQTLKEVAIQLGTEIPDGKRSVWPAEFDAKDAEKEVETLLEILSADIGPTFETEARYRIATTAMPDLDETARAQGREEIETAINEQEEGADETLEEVADRTTREAAQAIGAEIPEGEAR